MKNGKYGLGILGLGGRGVYFGGKSFQASENFYIACLCDVKQEKCDAARAILGSDIPAYTDVHEFLQYPNLDAVIVATPDYAHAACAIEVLKAQKHLYLEKPMAQTIEDCDAIIEAWKGSGTVFMVGLELRYCTLMQHLECHFTPEYTREFMFIGDKGKIEAFYNNEQEFRIKLWKRFEKDPVYFYPPKVEGGHGGGDPGIIRDFFETIREGKPCMKGIKGARDSAAIAIAAYESEKTGLPVTIPPVAYPDGLV